MILHQAKFNDCFQDINQYRGRYRVFMGGAGSGKSFNIAQDFIIKLSNPQYQGANLIVIRKAYSSHKNSCFAQVAYAIQHVFGKDAQALFIISRQTMSIQSRVTGNTIIFLGMLDEQARERLKSIQTPNGKICWIWCEEATELTQQDFELLDDRLRGILPKTLFYQITLSFNPVHANHWIKKRFFDQVDKQAMISCTTYKDNRFIDYNFDQRMQQRKKYDPQGYRIYALGQWGESSGLILDNFTQKDFTVDIALFDSMAFGTDFGFNHPHVTLLLGFYDDVIYVCQEIVLYGKDTNEIQVQLEQFFGEYKNTMMWCDSAEPDRIRTFIKHGWKARGVKKEAGSILAQIDWLKQRQIVIHPTCTQTLTEMQSWKWKEDKGSGKYLDEPENGDDDAMAALRYGIEGWRKNQNKISFQ